MSIKNYYQILEVQQNASEQEIKSAYRKLAKTHHPDTGGSEDHFKLVVEAYNTLKDTTKKRAYDGQIGRVNQFQNPIFNEFFHSVFSGRTGPTRTNVESLDIILEHKITIQQFFNGKKERIHYKKKKFDSKKNENLIVVSQDINIRKGSQQKDLQIIIPNGGHESRKIQGKFGHLVIMIRVLDSPPLFIKHGNNIMSEIPIPLNLALVGAEIPIPTLHGLKTVKIMPYDCFFSKKPIVLKGYGLQKGLHTDQHGDQIVHIGIETPQTLTDEQKEFFRNMSTAEEVYPEFNKTILSKQKRH